MEIIKREFIYREKTGLEPAQFKTYINKHIRELRAREDVYKVSGIVTEDFSKCTVSYTIILPDHEPIEIDEENDEEPEYITEGMENVIEQLG